MRSSFADFAAATVFWIAFIAIGIVGMMIYSVVSIVLLTLGILLAPFSADIRSLLCFDVNYIDNAILELEQTLTDELTAGADGLNSRVKHLNLHIVLEKHLLSSARKKDSIDVTTVTMNIHVLWSSMASRNCPNIILIHGCGSSWFTFSNVIPFLATSCNIFAIDLPGFGRSKIDGVFGIHDIRKLYGDNTSLFYVDVLSLCIKELSLDSIYLCGHSFGGYIASLTAGQLKLETCSVKGLILINSAGIFPTLGEFGAYYGCVFKFSIPNIGKYLGRTGYIAAKLVFQNSTATLFKWYLKSHPDAFGDQIVADQIQVSFKSVYWRNPMFTNIKRMQTRFPICVIYGEDDTIMPAHQGRALEFLRGIDFFGIPRASHSPMQTAVQGRLTFKAVMTFLDKCASKHSVGAETDTMSGIAPDFGLTPSSYQSSFNTISTRSTIARLYRDLGATEKICKLAACD
jgi:pimeloyl-ACP methyl ester carboxylesterase